MALDAARTWDAKQVLTAFGELLERHGLRTRFVASAEGGLAMRGWDPGTGVGAQEVGHDGMWLTCGGHRLTSEASPSRDLEVGATLVVARARGAGSGTMRGAAWLKLALLAHGVAVDDSFAAWFKDEHGAVRRRNFYNSPVHHEETASLPQEIRLVHGGRLPVTVAVNVYGSREWTLVHDGTQPAVRCERLGITWPVQVPDDLGSLRQDPGLARVCNLYGGSALAFFSPRACYFFTDGTQCRFCSLAGTAAENGYANRLTPEQVGDAVGAVLAADGAPVNQVMIVGGNERNLDRGFRRHVALARAACEAVTASAARGRVSVHLVTMPPADHCLIDELASVGRVHVGFNLEMWNRRVFERIAPGKAADYGQDRILAALERLVTTVGEFRAHSILIAGLEPAEATLEGAAALAAMGVSPIINAYHSDVHSALGLSVRPSYDALAEVAVGLADLHAGYPIQPYWKGCGRNALDFEASHGMFTGDPLPLGGAR